MTAVTRNFAKGVWENRTASVRFALKLRQLSSELQTNSAESLRAQWRTLRYRRAQELCISEITVKNHRGNVMRKMMLRSLPELVTVAAKLSLTIAPKNEARTERSKLRYQTE